ncbi:MAG: dockerin type I domain-containing protein [Armatimonadota bacterium]
MVEPGATTTVDFTVRLLPDLNPATNEVFEDNFAGTSLKPEWTARIPVAGPTITVKDGLQIALPDGFFDYWAGFGDSPEVVLPAPAGDFVAFAQIRSVTDANGDPLDGLNYHAVLTVNFGGTDSFMWGAYQSNSRLMLERSGINSIGSTDIEGLPAWVQIKKVGNTYTFAYKTSESDPWTDLTDANGNPISLYVPQKAVAVGLMMKSWNPGGACVANFGSFRLEGPKLRFNGTVAGKVTAAVSVTGWAVQALDAEGTVVAAAPVGTDGTYTLSVPSGIYSLRLVDSTLGQRAVKDAVTIERTQTTTVDFDLTAPAVVPGDLDGNGRVTISDATIALRVAVGLQVATAQQLAAGDLNKDGSIGMPEVTRILRAAVGLGTLWVEVRRLAHHHSVLRAV